MYIPFLTSYLGSPVTPWRRPSWPKSSKRRSKSLVDNGVFTPVSSSSLATSGPSLKIVNILRSYSGKTNLIEWLRKFDHIKEQFHWRDSVYLPLYLEGEAFDVFEHLPDDVKSDDTKLRAALTRAFGISEFDASAEFTSRKLRPGENIEFYISELQNLGKLFGLSCDDLEPTLKMQFLAGLPEAVSSLLRTMQAGRVAQVKISELVQQAKSLLAAQSQRADGVMGAVASSSFGRGRFQAKKSETRSCFACNQVGHLASACTQATQKEKERRCFFCVAKVVILSLSVPKIASRETGCGGLLRNSKVPRFSFTRDYSPGQHGRRGVAELYGGL